MDLRFDSAMREPRSSIYILNTASFISEPSGASFAIPGSSVVVRRNLAQKLRAFARDRVDPWRPCSDATCMIGVAILGVERIGIYYQFVGL